MPAEDRYYCTWKDHTKNEDILREGNIEPMAETTEMVWPRVKEGREGYHQKDAEYAGKEKKEEAQKKMDRQQQG